MRFAKLDSLSFAASSMVALLFPRLLTGACSGTEGGESLPSPLSFTWLADRVVRVCQKLLARWNSLASPVSSFLTIVTGV